MTRVARLAVAVCLLAAAGGWAHRRLSAAELSGEGAGKVFDFSFTSSGGAAAIATTEVLIAGGTAVTGAHNCYFFTSGRQLWLRDDAHTEWLGPVTAGSSGTVANSQCTIFAAGLSITASGGSVAMSVPVTFAPAFAGLKTIYTRATDRAGVASDLLRAGTWTVTTLNPAFDVITSSCANPASDPLLGIQTSYEQGGRVFKYLVTPSCFPAYANFLPQEGWFADSDPRPIPIMGRTCGHFDVLVVFVDTDGNRRKLYDNPDVPSAVKPAIADGRMQEALTDLFASYTPTSMMDGVTSKIVSKALGFTFSIGITQLTQRQLDTSDGGLGFANHDAVLVIDDMGAISAHGIERWPAASTRPMFYGKDGSFFLHIDPFRLTPALFIHELLVRNVPWGLKEYQYGDPVRVVEGGVTYDRTPIVNPRTGENIEPLLRANAGAIPLGEYIAGFADVDRDGIPDCIDPVITPTSDNLDGDFIPDRYDPDLTVSHRPYSWMYATRQR